MLFIFLHDLWKVWSSCLLLFLILNYEVLHSHISTNHANSPFMQKKASLPCWADGSECKRRWEKRDRSIIWRCRIILMQASSPFFLTVSMEQRALSALTGFPSSIDSFSISFKTRSHTSASRSCVRTSADTLSTKADRTLAISFSIGRRKRQKHVSLSNFALLNIELPNLKILCWMKTTSHISWLFLKLAYSSNIRLKKCVSYIFAVSYDVTFKMNLDKTSKNVIVTKKKIVKSWIMCGLAALKYSLKDGIKTALWKWLYS